MTTSPSRSSARPRHPRPHRPLLPRLLRRHRPRRRPLLPLPSLVCRGDEQQQQQRDGDEDMEVDDFVPLDALMRAGIAAADCKKLKDAGFCTATGVLMVTKKVTRAAAAMVSP